MKTFRFKAKQKQTDMVCRIIVENFGIKPKVTAVDDYHVITFNLPKKVSKRSVDKLLFQKGVPGAKFKKSKYKVIAGENFEIVWNSEKHKYKPFIWVVNGKFMGLSIVQDQANCSCCGPWYQIVPYKKK